MNLQEIIISAKYHPIIGLYLENKTKYPYEWLIDFLNQFTSDENSLAQLVVLIANLKIYNQNNNIEIFANDNDYYVYTHETLGNVLFIMGDTDGTQLIFSFEHSIFKIENCLCPKESLQIDANQLIVWLDDWLFCLQNGHFQILFPSNQIDKHFVEASNLYNKHPDFSKKIPTMQVLGYKIKIIRFIATLHTLSTRRPLLVREKIELDFLQKIQAAENLETLQSIENEVNSTPTDPELIKQLQRLLAEKKAFY